MGLRLVFFDLESPGQIRLERKIGLLAWRNLLFQAVGERPTKPPVDRTNHTGSGTRSLLRIFGSSVLLGRLHLILEIRLLAGIPLIGTHVLAWLFSNRPFRLARAVPGSSLLQGFGPLKQVRRYLR